MKARRLDDWEIDTVFGRLVLRGWDRYRRQRVAEDFLYQTGHVLTGEKARLAPKSWNTIIFTKTGHKYLLMKPGRGWFTAQPE